MYEIVCVTVDRSGTNISRTILGDFFCILTPRARASARPTLCLAARAFHRRLARQRHLYLSPLSGLSLTPCKLYGWLRSHLRLPTLLDFVALSVDGPRLSVSPGLAVSHLASLGGSGF